MKNYIFIYFVVLMHAIKNELCERLICLGNIFRKDFYAAEGHEKGEREKEKRGLQFSIKKCFQTSYNGGLREQATVWAALPYT